MMVYTPIRRVERLVGRGLRGGRFMLGPFNLRREFPILFGGCCVALMLVLAEVPIMRHMLTNGPSGVSQLAAVLVLLLAVGVLVGTIMWVTWRRGAPSWPPHHVRSLARWNQVRRRPVTVDGKVSVQ